MYSHLKTALAAALIQDGIVQSSGERRWTHYRLTQSDKHSADFSLAEALSEDRVWELFFKDRITQLASVEKEILNYGATEMINNVIDHSGATNLHVEIWRTAISTTLKLTDNGIGIFQKIASALHLDDLRQSLLELGKEKFTTDPKRHTGEGVFFTSRMFDCFSIRSSDLLFTRTAISDDWFVELASKQLKGTSITMILLHPARRNLESVFARYSSGPEDYRFAKTQVPLRLAAFGDENLLSRSSAKRVLARIERFDEVLLDFKEVDSIGPAFADEIFRVFAREHPKVQLIVINANAQITAMIRRAQSHSQPD
ncbi:MAG TPA: DUF4325 domain-containing protein [Tepidisphaeraceae bacterium]|nr:DUF4325 domain-containing protein [Tepidisphaeraceae bacterium]